MPKPTEELKEHMKKKAEAARMKRHGTESFIEFNKQIVSKVKQTINS